MAFMIQINQNRKKLNITPCQCQSCTLNRKLWEIVMNSSRIVIKNKNDQESTEKSLGSTHIQGTCNCFDVHLVLPEVYWVKRKFTNTSTSMLGTPGSSVIFHKEGTWQPGSQGLIIYLPYICVCYLKKALKFGSWVTTF